MTILTGRIVCCYACGHVMNARELVTDDGKHFTTYQCTECGERLPAIDITPLRNFEASRSHAETTAAGGDCLPTTAVAARSDDRRSA